MGWFYTHGASRRDIIKEQITLGQDHEVLRHCCRGNVLWAVIHTRKAGLDQTWIYCGLMQRSQEGWGYKPMDESMGPCYLTCPLSYIEQCSEPVNDWAREWRDKVRQQHTRTS